MQNETNLRTSTSHTPLTSFRKFEKGDLVVVGSFYEFGQGSRALYVWIS